MPKKEIELECKHCGIVTHSKKKIKCRKCGKLMTKKNIYTKEIIIGADNADILKKRINDLNINLKKGYFLLATIKPKKL